MALSEKQRAVLLGFVDVLFTPAAIERARRVEATHTGDGRLRADMLTGEVPGYVLPMIELGQLPAPDGSGYDTLEEYINSLGGAFLPIADPTFTGTLSGPTLAVTGDATIGDDLHVTDALGVDGDSSLGNGDGDLTLVWGHLRHKSSAPSIAVGAALGTGGSVGATITGSDQAGIITLVAGTAALTTGILATITFATARPSTDYALAVTPRNTTAGVNAIQVYAVRDSASVWTIRGNVAPTSGSTYGYHYQVLEWGN